MSFVEKLREARSSSSAILQEFWTNYDPNLPRVHAFVEGDDDQVFYRIVLQARTANTQRLYIYRCQGKERVYEVFRKITDRLPSCKGILFFVDKDLDDIIGRPWPTDPRIFVTDVYSVENYLVSRQTFTQLMQDFVQFRGVNFDLEVLAAHFERELNNFYRRILPLMALVVLLRRLGHRPYLNDVQLGQIFGFSADSAVCSKQGTRLAYLSRVCRIPGPIRVHRLREVARELKRLPPKRFVRGKSELWFLVEFVKRAFDHLQHLAAEAGGSVRFRNPVEHSNAIAILANRIATPLQLDLFLNVHLSAPLAKPEKQPSFWTRVRHFFKKD